MAVSINENWQTLQGRIGLLLAGKIFSTVSVEKELFAKTLREGAKKEDNSVLTSLTAQKYGPSFENKSCGHSEKSLLYRPI